ncbi:MAG: nucleoside deaminase [Candidatus Zophobacter franzmannii]|nr:nucleoside deaminase [Candidatus Zophobacter franzmannii]
MIKTDIDWMKEAYKEAEIALAEGEIPIGAVLVKDGTLVLADHNRTKQLANPLAHAEKLIIDKLVSSGETFFNDYRLFVTLEPCTMCAGTIIWSRIGTVVFGAYDEKAGAVGSIYNVLRNKNLNHNPIIKTGVYAKQCSAILTTFFTSKR